MLDIKQIRETPDFVRQRLATRGAGDEALVDQILEMDERRRRLLTEVERLKAERNRASKEIGRMLAEGKTAEAEVRKQETRVLGDRIAELDRQVMEVDQQRDALMLRIPNLPHETVPLGRSAEENQVVRVHGEPPRFEFPPRAHLELCERLGLVDFARAAKVAGSGFALYMGRGARLERALIRFMLDLHTRDHGYTEVWPPLMVGPACLEGVGQFPKFRDQYYGVAEGDDPLQLGRLYLIPTAETVVANLHREEILRESELPIRYCAYTPCFRGEAGAAGVGTRGLIRMHQFDKVELIQITRPEEGYAAHEAMVQHAERVLQMLGLHYRVVLLCSGDLGFASAKTYDLEVWAPGQGSYLEVSSVSNCEEFQARRMRLRFKDAHGLNRHPHILNGSGTALARLYVALVETYQQADGSVLIPPALRPYYGEERILP
ncbi:MAG: serine--tRNA ligase [Verrucomicrobiota bacterium]|nr:serine--tRNA ligase [Limisphaera sp.]MDW8382290.1 serine--tRNA ligase [Verrucomicrobiota bacterium]